jgi:hypothetical protein
MIKKFKDWLVEYGGPSYEPSFYEKFESQIHDAETRLKKEIPGFDGADFWDKLDDLDSIEKFEEDLEKFAMDHLNDYLMKPESMDDYEPSFTPLGKKIHDEALHHLKSTKNFSMLAIYSLEKQRFFEDSINKYWEQYKKIYLKWIDFIDSHHGFLAGKKFNL